MPPKKSRSRRPIMRLLEVVGRRWALRVLWELRRGGPLSFRALASACGGLSPTTLNSRLSELQELGAVEHRAGEGYALTESGQALGEALLVLGQWADEHLGSKKS